MRDNIYPEFLSVKPGDYVLLSGGKSYLSKTDKNYWIGQVLNCIGGARDPSAWTLFQIINIDNGEILTINADIVEMILNTTQT